MNAKKELMDHVGMQNVKHVHIVRRYWDDDHEAEAENVIAGTLEEVLPLLDFEYDNGYGGQELFGNIWYTDGTWSERGEYDGSEWWEYKACPPIPDKANTERP